MSVLAGLAVQKAIYAVLSGDATLASMVFGIYDQPPDSPTPPYVVIGDAIETAADTMGDALGVEVVERVHVWTQYHGRKQGLEIADRVAELLHGTTLTLDAPWVHQWTRREQVIQLDELPYWHHVVVEFRVRARAW